ncbi:MAG: prepilin peptidase [Gammaproteobacteria bacterium]|nr:prepilin peptidase [Gammaproteobacteria bacterium]
MFYIIFNNWVFVILVGLLGLAVGSFLNVVIHRLPKMMDRHWHQACQDYFKEGIFPSEQTAKYNLAYPASHCPFCKHPLNYWENIPLLSYLLLGGKCAYCKANIPVRYFLVELLSCVLSIVIAVQFGPSWELISVLLLTWTLIALSFIDLEQKILPDLLTLFLLWLGLFVNCFGFFSNCHDAVLGAIFGYAFFWIIEKLFKLLTRQEGIGAGDCKLLAAIGAWVGWQILPFVILTSSALGLVVGGGALLLKGLSRKTPIPFGPFIAIAGFIAIIWGFDITQSYLQFFGIYWTNI